MATIVQGKKGKTVALSGPERIMLAKRLSARMGDRSLEEISRASTLSKSTIAARLRDVSGSATTHSSLWSILALSDAVGIRPSTIAKMLGVEISTQDIASARSVVFRRKSRHARQNGRVRSVSKPRPSMQWAEELINEVTSRVEKRLTNA